MLPLLLFRPLFTIVQLVQIGSIQPVLCPVVVPWLPPIVVVLVVEQAPLAVFGSIPVPDCPTSPDLSNLAQFDSSVQRFRASRRAKSWLQVQ